jgi:hypothetical protein
VIKLVYCMHRRPEYTHEQFLERWHVEHAPLLTARRDVLRVKAYEQLHTTTDAFSQAVAAARGGPAPFDGLAVVTYESIADMQASLADRDARRAAREMIEDERKFIDLDRSPVFLTTVNPIF